MRSDSMKIDTDLLLEDLKRDRSLRTQSSLDKLNDLLEKRFRAGEKDYSIATIGRISKSEGGIGDVSIRNQTGEHFRLLIDAWASKAQTTMKKPSVHYSRKKESPSDMELLKKLDDPAMRAIFGQIIAEKNKLKAENNILKQNANIIVDMRPNNHIQETQIQNQIEVLPSLSGILVSSEIEALRDAINENNILKRGWEISRLGGIKDENGRPLFKLGFISAIKKILLEI